MPPLLEPTQRQPFPLTRQGFACCPAAGSQRGHTAPASGGRPVPFLSVSSETAAASKWEAKHRKPTACGADPHSPPGSVMLIRPSACTAEGSGWTGTQAGSWRKQSRWGAPGWKGTSGDNANVNVYFRNIKKKKNLILFLENLHK